MAGVGAAWQRPRAVLDTRRRRALVVLPSVIVFYIFAVPLLNYGWPRSGVVLAAAGIAILAGLLRHFLILLVMSCLGARAVRMRIGAGPCVGFRVTPVRVLTFHAIPITISCSYLPRVRHYGRDLRIMNGTAVLAPLVLNLLGSLLLPSYAFPLSLVFGIMFTGADAVTRAPNSSRSLGTRAFRRASAAEDPQFGDPEWGHVAHGLIAAAFGDLGTAANELAYLRTQGHSAAAMLEATILTVRGDYAPAVRTQLQLAQPKPTWTAAQRLARPALLVQAAFLTLLVGERDAGTQRRAVELADQMLNQRGRAATVREAAPVLALRALMEADPAKALVLSKKQSALATTPMHVADALCTRARALAEQGQTAQAHAALSRAAAVAPWYARVAVVHALLGATLTEAVQLPAVDVAGEARLFEDPWAAPDV